MCVVVVFVRSDVRFYRVLDDLVVMCAYVCVCVLFVDVVSDFVWECF